MNGDSRSYFGSISPKSMRVWRLSDVCLSRTSGLK